MDKYTLMSV